MTTMQPPKRSILNRIKNRIAPGNADLRESLEGVMDSHAGKSGEESMNADARSMMRNVLGFSELRVDDLMVPRVNIVAEEETATMRGLLSQFIEANHSRLPIYRDSLDDIVGMIHVKDYLKWMTSKGSKAKSKTAAEAGISLPAKELSSTIKQHSSMIRDVLYVPPSMPASDLLIKMKASHIHLAVVVDEYGGTDGLVSLEDLVEEIIGDIADEHDTDDEHGMLRKQDDVTYVANALISIATLDEMFKVDLLPDDQEDEADTLGGLVFEMAGRVPSRGELLKHPSGLEFEILEADPRRVKRVRIHIKPPKPDADTLDDEGEG
ncbi:MAG: HlyC/CorC family transporter [Alphaproteobacteria bacterium]|nr:HlyC/CorC family transporter [Alphaproteobacteria bacterium]